MNTANQYTLSGKTYDLLIQDGDIIMQSLEQDLTFPKGFEACKDSARSYCKANATHGYSEWHVTEIAMEFIADYIKSETPVVTNYNLN